jgi:hypothetical protein
MNAITRRHRKLETKLVPPVDEEGTRLVELIRERRRRRLAAEGREPEEDPLREMLADGRQPRTLAEAIRSFRLRDRPR